MPGLRRDGVDVPRAEPADDLGKPIWMRLLKSFSIMSAMISTTLGQFRAAQFPRSRGVSLRCRLHVLRESPPGKADLPLSRNTTVQPERIDVALRPDIVVAYGFVSWCERVKPYPTTLPGPRVVIGHETSRQAKTDRRRTLASRSGVTMMLPDLMSR